MSYSEGKRPFEAASKSNHIHLIKDKLVQEFLYNHELPRDSEEIETISSYYIDIDYDIEDSINWIVAVDGGNTTIPVKSKFPSSTLTFFQFGANALSIEDLNSLKEEPYISPDNISKLKELHRRKLVIPTKNIGLKKDDGTRATLTFSVRKAIYDFFKNENLLETLSWFLFESYNPFSSRNNYELASHPDNIELKKIIIDKAKLTKDYCINHPDGMIFLTDVFRLHEVIDDDFGAGGVLGYLTNIAEHFILIDYIKNVYRRRKSALKEVVFIKDGPLGFFGQTANMHKPMRALINYLSESEDIYLVGIEKSGPFVEHAMEIQDKLKPGQAYLFSNKYIYKYIKPGDINTSEPFGKTSYYGSKLIFKSRDEKIYLITLPTKLPEVVLNPQKEDFHNIDVILKYIEKLRSDMYDNSLLPIALANKLVSLSDHPSSMILEKFAKSIIK
jgi:hypothetical protein